jgi:ketosteroid isomerase-like protein
MTRLPIERERREPDREGEDRMARPKEHKSDRGSTAPIGRVRGALWMLGVGILLAGVLTSCNSGQDADAQAALQKRVDIADIEQIEVTWHRASSTKDVDLMMSIWADDATFTIGDTILQGKDEIRAFFEDEAAPFQAGNHWISETPAYKVDATVSGDTGTLYFECHYVDADTGKVVQYVAADQDVARIGGKWLITRLVAATPELTP